MIEKFYIKNIEIKDFEKIINDYKNKIYYLGPINNFQNTELLLTLFDIKEIFIKNDKDKIESYYENAITDIKTSSPITALSAYILKHNISDILIYRNKEFKNKIDFIETMILYLKKSIDKNKIKIKNDFILIKTLFYDIQIEWISNTFIIYKKTIFKRKKITIDNFYDFLEILKNEIS